MEFEFDKEMDFLLRQTARGEAVSAAENSKSNHLDADEIAAFAENALPEKARSSYIAHLADCDHCRKLLSNSIALNSESPSEIVHAENESETIKAAPEIPWYRRLFAVPTLAYAMGGLTLLFAGIGVFTVLQNDPMSSQISQVPEKQIGGGGKGMSSDGDAAQQENQTSAPSNTAATANRMSTNATANASNSAALAAPSAPSAANANATTARREPEQTVATTDDSRKDESFAADSRLAENKEAPGSAAPPPAAPSLSTVKTEDAEKRPQPTPAAQAEAEEDRQQNPPKPSIARAAPSAKMRRAEDLKKKADASETTTVGGKTFKRSDNIWVDTAYRGQTTTNVSRGTNDYKNLDSGLRGIVENLGGTVIVVWKEKAYRIQ